MKYAFITGGSRGIGRAIAKQMVAAGYGVTFTYVSNDAAARELVAELQACGGTVESLKFDVADPIATEKALSEWEEKHTDDFVEVLVNNAGVCVDQLMIFMQDDAWHKVLDTTLNGFFYITRRLLKNMISKRNGRIINIASLSGLKGLPGQVNYSAAKAALIGATKALAQEVAKRKITVNAVAPGFIASDMTKDLPVQELEKMIPMGRFGTAEEVANLVSFLASPAAAYITGQVISINGGLYS
jgi:3-oxoacyl-[acyl-carrier-protein] reductase